MIIKTENNFYTMGEDVLKPRHELFLKANKGLLQNLSLVFANTEYNVNGEQDATVVTYPQLFANPTVGGKKLFIYLPDTPQCRLELEKRGFQYKSTEVTLMACWRIIDGDFVPTIIEFTQSPFTQVQKLMSQVAITSGSLEGVLWKLNKSSDEFPKYEALIVNTGGKRANVSYSTLDTNFAPYIDCFSPDGNQDEISRLGIEKLNKILKGE